ncbi:SirA-like protein [Basidiobolus meristosporus CBS 931.73]|uniref:SirA-like protein n=1 Tax=Basidiobolus meristosporus CBS 931.73 TaxID=1314790 RepID=A0A1Y1WDW1_9FUNG|nr:SirA-like protein [Basidiobolus meristosporus CBS 931.73]|eukprot:ORX71719.1 SirA-like protein [Basidiobolus meristosporus CBS 931.73]
MTTLEDTLTGAINIPLDDLREHLAEIPTNRPVVLYCTIGLRGYLAQRILMGHGYRNVRNLTYSTSIAPVPKPFPVPSSQSTATPTETPSVALKVNVCALQCPGPILQVKQAMDKIAIGERVEIIATDAGLARDAAAWCNATGNQLVEKHEEKGRYTIILEKAAPTVISNSTL